VAAVGELVTDRGPLAVPERALVVCAHPDDVDFGAAGTVAALVRAGCSVSYCLVTSGDAGDDDLTRSAEELRELREAEQRAAAAAVGVEDLTFLRHPDGMVVADLALRRDLARVIRRCRPELVICQSPVRILERIFASHPDHLAAGEATLCAVYPDARNPRAFPELLEEGHAPHTVPQVWLMAHPEPDLMVDVTETFADKMAALRAHTSQTGHRDGLDEMVSGWLAANAEGAGFDRGRLAEAFKVVPTA
jgi:LmbE family N-acetylglucosaminyl deacetylase